MNCPICDRPTEVYDSRKEDGNVRRRRQCPAGHRFITEEVVVDARPRNTFPKLNPEMARPLP